MIKSIILIIFHQLKLKKMYTNVLIRAKKWKWNDQKCVECHRNIWNAFEISRRQIQCLYIKAQTSHVDIHTQATEERSLIFTQRVSFLHETRKYRRNCERKHFFLKLKKWIFYFLHSNIRILKKSVSNRLHFTVLQYLGWVKFPSHERQIEKESERNQEYF